MNQNNYGGYGMVDGTQIHNEICRTFKSEKYTKMFLQLYTKDGCKKIKKIIFEDIISNNNILIGYCDVVIDYEDNDGRTQKALIEVKSSGEIINEDPQSVLRQIKKYRFYNKKFTKTFLIYSTEENYELVEDTTFFTDEDITVVEVENFDLECIAIEEKLKKKEAEKIIEKQREKERVQKEKERVQREKERKIKIAKDLEETRKKNRLQKSINSPGYRNKWFGN
jgi:hypothetical protein